MGKTHNCTTSIFIIFLKVVLVTGGSRGIGLYIAQVRINRHEIINFILSFLFLKLLNFLFYGNLFLMMAF